MRAPAALALAFLAGFSRPALAQTDPLVVGPVKDIVRTELVYPAVFDPLITLPLTPNPQAVIEARGSDVVGTARVGVRTGDTSYSVTLSGPIHRGAETAFLDRHNIPVISLGWDLTNTIWRPKAKPSLVRQLGTAGFLTSSSGQPLDAAAQGTVATALSRESQEAVAHTINTTDAIDLPVVLFVNAGYKFAKKDYNYTDLRTLTATSAGHLSDVAHVLVGAQFLARGNDPGYFAAMSFNYSAVFYEKDMKLGPPDKLQGIFLRVEMRRTFAAAHLGIIPSMAYEFDTHVKTVEAAAYYWLSRDDRSHVTRNSTKLNVGVRVGYQSERGGLFASVFVGPTFRVRP